MGKVHWNRSDVKVPEADVKPHGGRLPAKAVTKRGRGRLIRKLARKSVK